MQLAVTTRLLIFKTRLNRQQALTMNLKRILTGEVAQCPARIVHQQFLVTPFMRFLHGLDGSKSVTISAGGTITIVHYGTLEYPMNRVTMCRAIRLPRWVLRCREPGIPAVCRKGS